MKEEVSIPGSPILIVFIVSVDIGNIKRSCVKVEVDVLGSSSLLNLSLIHISEPTRRA